MGTHAMIKKSNNIGRRSYEEVRQKAAGGTSNSAMATMMGGDAFKPLSPNLREKFESSFSANFENIRISRGHIPDELGIQAVTRGTDILVDNRAGDDVIGHELAHTVQQANSRVPQGGYPVVENAALEHEADVQGARAAAGAPVADSGDYTAIPAMSDTSAPAQCKSREEKKAEKQAERQRQVDLYATGRQAANAPNEEMVLKAGQAQGILDDVDEDTSMKSRNFLAAAERYNSTQTDPSKHVKKDEMDVRHQRFLQRHLTGTQEEQDEMVRSVMTEGDAGVNRYLAKDAQKVLAMPDNLIADEDDHEGLLRHGADVLKMSKDMHNFQDMINSGRSTAKDLGLQDDQMELLRKKLKHLAVDQSVKALRGTRSLAAAGTPEAQAAGRNAALARSNPVAPRKGFFARMFGF